MSAFGQCCRWWLAVWFGLASFACDGCRRDHPFTPFVVTSANPSATTVEVARPQGSAAMPMLLAQAEKLPPNSRHFPLGHRQAEAPESMTIDSVLRADWNGDGNVDAIALMRANPNATQPIGSVFLYDGGGDAHKLLDLPGWIPSSPDCNWDSQLLQVGKQAATVDVHTHCSTPMPPRTAVRLVAVISPYRAQPLVIGWRLADAAPGETYAVAVKMADLDGDHTDDVTLSLSLGLDSGREPARAEFAWVDRAAGVSRESGQLAASLGPTLATLEKKAVNRNTATEALTEAAMLWRLLGSSCAEFGTPRLFSMDGAAITCAGFTAIAVRLASIEVRASLAQNGDVLRAAFALMRSRWLLGTSLSAAELTPIVKLIRKACTTPATITAIKSDIRPVGTARGGPHYSPLQFQADGTLFVISGRGVLRLQPDGREPAEDSDAGAIESWPLVVDSTDGRTWESLVASCDRSEITLLSKSSSGSFLSPDVTSFLAPRPGLCSGRTALNWHVSPLRFDEGKPPLILAEGACMSQDGTNPCLKPQQLGKLSRGAPVSPDSRWLVAATGLGLFVIGAPKPELWDGPTIGNPETLSDCVVANGGERIACIRGARVWQFSKSTPPAPNEVSPP